MRFRTSGMSPRASRAMPVASALQDRYEPYGHLRPPARSMPRPVKAMTGENVEAIKKVLQDNGLPLKLSPGTRPRRSTVRP